MPQIRSWNSGGDAGTVVGDAELVAAVRRRAVDAHRRARGRDCV